MQACVTYCQRPTPDFGAGRCALAVHRDTWDPNAKQFVCGFNTEGPADDTVLVAQVISDGTGATLGTIVGGGFPASLRYDGIPVGT